MSQRFFSVQPARAEPHLKCEGEFGVIMMTLGGFGGCPKTVVVPHNCSVLLEIRTGGLSTTATLGVLGVVCPLCFGLLYRGENPNPEEALVWALWSEDHPKPPILREIIAAVMYTI